MRFATPRDYAILLHINRELMDKVVDIPVLIFKLSQQTTKTNSYSEAPKKTWYPGVQISCLINREQMHATEDMETINFEQSVTFAFLRTALDDLNIYPETGDYLSWDDRYYEVDTTNEVQLWAGRPEYKHNILCNAHLTRVTSLQLEPVV